MSNLSSSPVNFQRFLELARSSSRSLSPENELRQMTVQNTLLGLSDLQAVCREAAVTGGHGKLRGGDGEGAAMLPSRRNFCSTDVDRVSTRTTMSLSTSLSTTGRSAAGGSRAASASRGSRRSPRTGAHMPVTVGPSATAERPHSDPDDDRGPMDEALANAARWQYGAPLYYPVTQEFFCWNYHRLETKPLREYTEVEGVSCDFCGHTRWHSDSDASSAQAVCNSDGNEATGTQRQKAPPLDVVFYHCATCGMDLCPHCIAEVRRTERFHVPCLQCRSCGVYLPLHASATHRCQRFSSPTGQLLAVVKTEEDKREVARLRIRSVEELDLLTPAPVATTQRFVPPAASSAPFSVWAASLGRDDVKSEPEEEKGQQLLARRATGRSRGPKRDRPGSPPTSTVPSTTPRTRRETAKGGARTARDRSPRGRTGVDGTRARKSRVQGSTASPANSRSSSSPAQKSTSRRRSAANATAPQVGWEVRIQSTEAEDHVETMRLLEDFALTASPRHADGAMSLVFPTRLAAEKLAGRAEEAGLQASLQRLA